MNKKGIIIMNDLFLIINLLENLNIKYWIDSGCKIEETR